MDTTTTTDVHTEQNDGDVVTFEFDDSEVLDTSLATIQFSPS